MARCPACGLEGPHYVPPSLGEEGFFICAQGSPTRPVAAPDQHIVVLVGMIASGKSTYCREAALNGALIVNDDALVLALHGGHYNCYDVALKTMYKAVEEFMIRQAIAHGRTVIVDRPNLSLKTRARYVRMAAELRVAVEAVVFPMHSPERHGTFRFWADSRGVTHEKWIEIAKEHLKEYDPVTFDEGFICITHREDLKHV